METQGQGLTGNSAKETNSSNSSELESSTERIEGTPFLRRWEKENGYSFGLGNYRISEWYKTEKEMLKKLKEKDWDTIAGLIGVVVDATLKQNNLIK